MKIIKTFEEWSPVFNRTLQGAAALATSTKKPNEKKQSIEDYANRSISKEEFMLKVFNGDSTSSVQLGPNTICIVHDPKFILKPIEKLASVNVKQSDLLSTLTIPVIFKYNKKEDGTVVPTNEKSQPWIITFTEDGIITMKSQESDPNGRGLQMKFVNRASIENFIAMAIQAITSSPEKGTMSPFIKSGFSKEKHDILNLIQKIILDKDMRTFTI
jgi:hypothetical protein